MFSEMCRRVVLQKNKNILEVPAASMFRIEEKRRHFSALKMEAAGSCETTIPFCQFAGRNTQKTSSYCRIKE
jgi:hypothetical protein